MTKRRTLSGRFLGMIISSVILIAVFITVSGCLMIYNEGAEGIEHELSTVVHTLVKLYDDRYPGDYSDNDGVFKKGDTEITAEGFEEMCSLIGSSDDVYFTFFRDDFRLYTNIVNSDGTSAVGTRADANVTDNVLRGGQEYYYRRILINGEKYIGFYVPIFDASGKSIGMFFAGKSLATVIEKVRGAIIILSIISALVLFILIAFCSLTLKQLAAVLTEIDRYIAEISNGNFEVEMSNNTLERDDEIGEIGNNVVKLRGNLKDMIENDPLTNLINRRTCYLRINELTESGTPFTVAMADVDYFKKVNDNYGHACGDLVLKMISSELREYARLCGGFVSRWGGEEFLMVLPKYNAEQTNAVLEDVMKKIRKLECDYCGKKVSVTITVGISQHIEGDHFDDTVNRADKRLYYGKQNGRNRIIME